MAKPTKKEKEVEENRLIGFESPIQEFASEVVDVLTARLKNNKPKLRSNVLNQLVAKVSGPSAKDPNDIVDDLRQLRLSDEDILDRYIPEAARQLGRLWEYDELSFAKVTIGSARLQSMLHYLSDRWVDGTGHVPPHRSNTDIAFVLVTPKGDEHSLGIVTMAAKLRRRGHLVQLLLGATNDEIQRVLHKQMPDCLMFSCSDGASLEQFGKLCQKTKTTMDNPPVIAIGGVVLDHEEGVEERTGADLATQDLQTVLHLCLSRRAGHIAVVSK